MKIATTSVVAHQFAQDHIARATKWPYFEDIQYADLAEYNPDILVIAGWFVEEYADWALHRTLCGDIPKIVVHWMGMDVDQVEHFHLKGERYMFQELSDPKFIHVPITAEIGKRLEALGLTMAEPLYLPVMDARRDVPVPTEPPFTVACFINPDKISQRFQTYVNSTFGKVEEVKFIFYNWMPPVGNVGFSGYSEEKYALDYDGLNGILDKSNALLMTAECGLDITEAARYLMSGRPVISDKDLPHWAAKISSQKPRKIAGLFDDLRNGIGLLVPDHVREFYFDQFDPLKYEARILERVAAQEAKLRAA